MFQERLRTHKEIGIKDLQKETKNLLERNVKRPSREKVLLKEINLVRSNAGLCPSLKGQSIQIQLNIIQLYYLLFIILILLISILL